MGYSTGRDFFPLATAGHAPANTGGLVDLSPKFKVPAHSLKGAIFIAPAAGTAGSLAITMGGTFAVGDQIRVTITSNLVSAPGVWRKSYLIEVKAGATALADIAQSLADAMNADVQNANAPIASATAAAAVVTVTQKGDDKRGLNSVKWTDSSAGTVTIVPTATTISEGQPDDLRDAGVAEADITLASYDTVRIILHADAQVPFIGYQGSEVREIIWYGTPGNGNALATLINGL